MKSTWMFCIACAALLVEKEKIGREEFESLFVENSSKKKTEIF